MVNFASVVLASPVRATYHSLPSSLCAILPAGPRPQSLAQRLPPVTSSAMILTLGAKSSWKAHDNAMAMVGAAATRQKRKLLEALALAAPSLPPRLRAPSPPLLPPPRFICLRSRRPQACCHLNTKPLQLPSAPHSATPHQTFLPRAFDGHVMKLGMHDDDAITTAMGTTTVDMMMREGDEMRRERRSSDSLGRLVAALRARGEPERFLHVTCGSSFDRSRRAICAQRAIQTRFLHLLRRALCPAIASSNSYSRKMIEAPTGTSLHASCSIASAIAPHLTAHSPDTTGGRIWLGDFDLVSIFCST